MESGFPQMRRALRRSEKSDLSMCRSGFWLDRPPASEPASVNRYGAFRPMRALLEHACPYACEHGDVLNQVNETKDEFDGVCVRTPLSSKQVAEVLGIGRSMVEQAKLACNGSGTKPSAPTMACGCRYRNEKTPPKRGPVTTPDRTGPRRPWVIRQTSSCSTAL
jgi:hypothetical protein